MLDAIAGNLVTTTPSATSTGGGNDKLFGWGLGIVAAVGISIGLYLVIKKPQLKTKEPILLPETIQSKL